MKKVFKTTALNVFSGCVRNTSTFYLSVLLGVFVFTGCKKHDVNAPCMEAEQVGKEDKNDDAALSEHCTGLSGQTLNELRAAREATAKYLDIQNAYDDGYADINVVMPNMGYHFMKSEIVNPVFEVSKPELLVYNKDADGAFQLVAVEYAVPIDATPNAAPEGFTGSADVWDRNTDFGLWLLHAWVWKFNPAGVFHNTNPRVHVR
jgi:hypothetical protein